MTHRFTRAEPVSLFFNVRARPIMCPRAGRLRCHRVAKIFVILFVIRVDWSNGRQVYPQRGCSNGSDAQTALRRPSWGHEGWRNVFLVPSAGAPKCEHTCSRLLLGTVLVG